MRFFNSIIDILMVLSKILNGPMLRHSKLYMTNNCVVLLLHLMKLCLSKLENLIFFWLTIGFSLPRFSSNIIPLVFHALSFIIF